MREGSSAHVVLPEDVGLEATVRRATCLSTLQSVHGASVDATAWLNGRRTVRYTMPLPPGIPTELAEVVCGKDVRFSVQQAVRAIGKDGVELGNKVRMHFLGAELLQIRPRMMIRRDPDTNRCSVQAHVKVNAVLPTPLNRLAESFMLRQSEVEFAKWAAVIVGTPEGQQHENDA